MVDTLIQEEKLTGKQKFEQLSAHTALEVQDAIIGTGAHDLPLSTARGNIQVKSDALSEDGEGIFEVTSYGDSTPFEVVIKTIPPTKEGEKEKKEYKVYIGAGRKFFKYSGDALVEDEIEKTVRLGNFLNHAKRLAKQYLSITNANETPFYIDHDNLVMKGNDRNPLSTKPLVGNLTPQRIYKKTMGKNNLPLNLGTTYRTCYFMPDNGSRAVADYLNHRRTAYKTQKRKEIMEENEPKE